jgi:tetratricopeptide (TPR) repeat protein
MKTKIKIALIGTAAVIFVAIIGGFLSQFGSNANKWITKEQYSRLLNQLDQNKELVDCLLQILDEKDIAIEDRDKTIERWITIHRELETKLAQRSTEETLIAEAKDKLTLCDLNGAEKLLTKSFEKNLKVVSEKGKVAAALNAFELGVIKELQIDYDAAIKFFEQAIQLDPENTDYLNGYGKFLETLGIYKEAAINYDKAWRIDREIYGSKHPKVINEYEKIIEAVNSIGKHQKTKNFYDEVLSFLKSIFGHGQSQTLMVESDWEATWEAIKTDLESKKKETQNTKNR